jgi:hypothetical protein
MAGMASGCNDIFLLLFCSFFSFLFLFFSLILAACLLYGASLSPTGSNGVGHPVGYRHVTIYEKGFASNKGLAHFW